MIPLLVGSSMQHLEATERRDDVQPRAVGGALESGHDGWLPGELERLDGERAHAGMPPPELDRLRGVEREMPGCRPIEGAAARAVDADAMQQNRRGSMLVGPKSSQLRGRAARWA